MTNILNLIIFFKLFIMNFKVIKTVNPMGIDLVSYLKQNNLVKLPSNVELGKNNLKTYKPSKVFLKSNNTLKPSSPIRYSAPLVENYSKPNGDKQVIAINSIEKLPSNEKTSVYRNPIKDEENISIKPKEQNEKKPETQSILNTAVKSLNDFKNNIVKNSLTNKDLSKSALVDFQENIEPKKIFNRPQSGNNNMGKAILEPISSFETDKEPQNNNRIQYNRFLEPTIECLKNNKNFKNFCSNVSPKTYSLICTPVFLYPMMYLAPPQYFLLNNKDNESNFFQSQATFYDENYIAAMKDIFIKKEHLGLLDETEVKKILESSIRKGHSTNGFNIESSAKNYRSNSNQMDANNKFQDCFKKNYSKMKADEGLERNFSKEADTETKEAQNYIKREIKKDNTEIKDENTSNNVKKYNFEYLKNNVKLSDMKEGADILQKLGKGELKEETKTEKNYGNDYNDLKDKIEEIKGELKNKVIVIQDLIADGEVASKNKNTEIDADKNAELKDSKNNNKDSNHDNDANIMKNNNRDADNDKDANIIIKNNKEISKILDNISDLEKGKSNERSHNNSIINNATNYDEPEKEKRYMNNLRDSFKRGNEKNIKKSNDEIDSYSRHNLNMNQDDDSSIGAFSRGSLLGRSLSSSRLTNSGLTNSRLSKRRNYNNFFPGGSTSKNNVASHKLRQRRPSFGQKPSKLENLGSIDIEDLLNGLGENQQEDSGSSDKIYLLSDFLDN